MAKVKLPKWFNLVVSLALIWNLLGVVNFIMQVTLSPEAIAALPSAEQDLINATPVWSILAFALGVFGGSLGCIGLLMRKSKSMQVLLVSLIAVVAQMGYWLFFTTAVEVYGPSTYGMLFVVIIIALLLFLLSRNGTKKGYLT